MAIIGGGGQQITIAAVRKDYLNAYPPAGGMVNGVGVIPNSANPNLSGGGVPTGTAQPSPSTPSTPPTTDWTPYLLVGGIVVVAIVIALAVK